MQTSHQSIVRHIDSVLQHLETHLPLANAHMVDYFTKNCFIEHVPADIRAEAASFGYQHVINSIYHQETEHLPSLHKYVAKSQALTLKNLPICLTESQFRGKLTALSGKNVAHLKLDIFMKPKKSHEVEVLSEAAAVIHDIAKTSHLIDIGDGKGYLSSMLALHHEIPVLGIDASETNTNGAIDRATKLSKVWNGVVTHKKTKETSIELYKQITKFVDENMDFQRLISHVFLEEPTRIGLVGLHTCGNLASTCLKTFRKSAEIKTICNVGCCYHHLSEEFLEEQQGQPFGFPLSSYLKTRKTAIGRDARMVAAQSVERILATHERPSRIIFYRALFETIIQKHLSKLGTKGKQVGRFRKSPPNFVEYCRKAANRIQIPLEMSDGEIDSLYSNYESKMDEMELFYLIRAMLAPMIETLILLDRLLFLVESGFEQSFVVQFFDPVVSPRCYGIVSIKT